MPHQERESLKILLKKLPLKLRIFSRSDSMNVNKTHQDIVRPTKSHVLQPLISGVAAPRITAANKAPSRALNNVGDLGVFPANQRSDTHENNHGNHDRSEDGIKVRRSDGNLPGVQRINEQRIESTQQDGKHRHDQQHDCRQKNPYAVQTVWKTEHEPQADAERSVRHRRRSAAVRRAAFGCPCLIVVDELRKIAARIEKRGQCDRQKTGQRDLLFLIDGASSFHKRQSRCL